MEEERGVVAERVRQLMEQRGWSYAQVGGKAGLDPTTVWKIAVGRTPSPGKVTLEKLSAAFGLNPSDLTGERPMPKRQPQVYEGGVAVPVWRRRVHAGGEGYWDDTTETVYVSLMLRARHPNVKAAIVTGGCMEPWVMPGESVVFDPDQSPVDRDMVIVTDDDGDTMVKWYRFDDDGLPYLLAADGTMLKPNGAKIEGVVIAAYRTDLRYPGS